MLKKKKVWKSIFALFCSLYFTVGFSENQPYGFNSALNPAKFQSPPKHAPLKLIEDGELNFAISFDYNAEDVKNKRLNFRRSIRSGVDALQEALEKCVGKKAPIVDANDKESLKKYRYLILIGKSVLTDEKGMKPLSLPKEGFEIRTFANGVAIAGYDGSLIGYDKLDSERIRQNGTSHGVHDFIERFLGVRFYFPGPGVIWPRVKNLTLNPVHYTDSPEFNNRFSHIFRSKTKQNFGGTRKINGKIEQWPESWKTFTQDYLKFISRWRIARGSSFVAGHSPRPRLWHKAHPDKKDMMFYRDPSGSLYFNQRLHTGNYFDVSNLSLADLYVEDCQKFYKTGWNQPWKGWFEPNSKYIFFGQSDTFVNNMDTATIRQLKLIPESRRGDIQGELSDVYARFHIYLAEEIKRKLPGKRLAIIPYHNYALPPVYPKYRQFPDNVDLRVCIYDFPKYIRNPQKVSYWKNQLKDWYAVLGNRPVCSMWLYNTATFPWGKAVFPRHVGEIPKKMGKFFGREGMYFDFDRCGLEWYYYPAYYCMYRAMWNPDFDVQAALDEHWPLLYGKAAPYLKEFDSILLERWDKVFAIKGQNRNTYKEAYPFPLLDKLEELLKQAENCLEPGSIEMLRFKLFATPWPEAIKRMRGSIMFNKPIYGIKKIMGNEKIKLDGKIEEKAWKRANVVPMQDPFGSGDKRHSLISRMLWDDSGIYASFDMKGKPKANRGEGKFRNDNVEIFISPGNDYFQFMVNSIGDIFVGKKTLKPVPTPFQADWNCKGVYYAVDLRDDGWSFEIFIPYNGLERQTPKPYTEWSMNIVGNKLSEPSECASFSLTQGNNHDVKGFGHLRFLGIGD